MLLWTLISSHLPSDLISFGLQILEECTLKKDAKVPLTFTTNVANTVLNAMAIHKLPKMIAENLKCCVKHVDEMKRNGVLHPFHFIRSTMDNCCYYGDPELQLLAYL